jgi:hypothetical protein
MKWLVKMPNKQKRTSKLDKIKMNTWKNINSENSNHLTYTKRFKIQPKKTLID